MAKEIKNQSLAEFIRIATLVAGSVAERCREFSGLHFHTGANSNRAVRSPSPKTSKLLLALSKSRLRTCTDLSGTTALSACRVSPLICGRNTNYLMRQSPILSATSHCCGTTESPMINRSSRLNKKLSKEDQKPESGRAA